MSRGGRRRARELALQVLYAIDIGPRRCGRPPLPARDVEIGAGETELAEALQSADRADREGVDSARTRGVFESVSAHFEAPPAARELAWSFVEAMGTMTAVLDERIAARSRNWRVERMAAVDRNILRLGTWELGETAVPAAVVIDEAVELARRYGSDASPAFVNGILDALASDLRSGEHRAREHVGGVGGVGGGEAS